MSDLVGNPEDRFSHDEAHILLRQDLLRSLDQNCTESSRVMRKSVFFLHMRNNRCRSAFAVTAQLVKVHETENSNRRDAAHDY